MAGGMRRGSGLPLSDRTGPVNSTTDPEPPPPAPPVEPPPGTPCWIAGDHERIAGVVLGWQQQPDGKWHALVTAWMPSTALAPRD